MAGIMGRTTLDGVHLGGAGEVWRQAISAMLQQLRAVLFAHLSAPFTGACTPAMPSGSLHPNCPRPPYCMQALRFACCRACCGAEDTIDHVQGQVALLTTPSAAPGWMSCLHVGRLTSQQPRAA